ncbi:rhodanese-like domain-containing protein [Corynebacterium sp. sy017]|uniref:rhodanese-like domain-containing protein n=1 Tax=unclassified Corynebacterium TaxID=2624378 RepID=UPI001184ABC2|nr:MULTISPECIES: rhodanese-like domain-containing protein [unclassified Corynebacterium]MBP3088467.1 rhodanese-like domain-containing protein [Corynebacterium sp. sy017]TSD91776.1 rhodanese-like domain-containing protein [Corynebacterium sp. SY003]
MRIVSVHDVPRDAQLIDVREVDEFAQVHASGSVNIPMSVFPEHLHELDSSKDIYVICKAGVRSAQVVSYLAGQGVSAINVDGGMMAWLAAQLPTE